MDEGRQLAEEHGMKFLEGSAKDGTGISEAFHELAQLIWHAQQVRRDSGHDHSGDDIIHLQEIPVYDKKQRKCCGGVEGIFSWRYINNKVFWYLLTVESWWIKKCVLIGQMF